MDKEEDNDYFPLLVREGRKKCIFFFKLYFIFGVSNRHCCHSSLLDFSILNQMLVLYCHTVVEILKFICQLGIRLETFTEP